MLQAPIYPLIITIFTLFLVVMQSIQTEKVLKYRLVLSFLNVAITIFVFAIYESIILPNHAYTQAYIYFNFAVYGIFILVLYATFKTATLKTNHYQLFVKSIKNSRWNAYYVVDKKERIKDMSFSLLQEINMEKDEVIGKKLFSILNKSIRFTRLNDSEINNRQLEKHYIDYKNHTEQGDEQIEELSFLNYEGRPIVLHLVMQPVFVLGKYKGRICVGEKKTDFDMLAVEKELNERNNELESIRHKFIATLELSEEGLFYIDLDERTIWASDSLVEQLHLPSNLLDLTDFRRLIEAEDLKKYLSILGDLTINKRKYTSSYRMMINHQYHWFREKGIRLFEDQQTATIMGTLNPIKTKHFQASHIDELDQLHDHNDFMVHMHQLFQSNRYFQCLVFRLKNIPKINESYGRDVGNMLMAEYIKKMRQNFVTESGGIFRISGIEFAVTLTDPRKMEVLESGVKTNPAFLNLHMQYGSIQADLEVFGGIAVGGGDAQEEHQLYQAAKQALNIAESLKYKSNICFYKDISS